MTDEDFTKALVGLVEQGKDGLPAMREMLRPAGQLERLIKLADRGARRAKRDGAKKHPGTFIPDDCPTEVERARAIAYWRKHGRADLEPRIEEQAEKFRVINADKSWKSWPGRWATFYMNAIDFTRPAPGSAPARVLVLLTSVDGWVARLNIFNGLAEDCPAGTWNAQWGPRPEEPGCMVPDEAFAAVPNNIRQQRK